MKEIAYWMSFAARTAMFFLIVHFYGMWALLLAAAVAILTIVMDKC